MQGGSKIGYVWNRRRRLPHLVGSFNNKLAFPLLPCPAVGSLPKPASINFVSETGEDIGVITSSRSKESQQSDTVQVVKDSELDAVLQSNQDSNPPPLMIGEGLPPVPGKLVNRIQSGHFIDLAELLPDRLGVITAYEEEEKAKQYSRRHKTVTNILEWVQCWNLHSRHLKIST